jgi:hypothetical protein
VIAAIDSVNVELKELVVVLESVAPPSVLRLCTVLDPESMVVEAVVADQRFELAVIVAVSDAVVVLTSVAPLSVAVVVNVLVSVCVVVDVTAPLTV